MAQSLSQRAWEWIKQQPDFSSKKLAVHMEVTLHQAQMVIGYLQYLGAIENFDPKMKPSLYRALDGANPQFKGKARLVHKPKSERQKAWQTMRFLNRFSIDEIVATAEVNRAVVERFLSDLTRAGYVKVISPQNRRLSMELRRQHRVQYLLIKNTGHKYPIFRKEGVYDQNEKVTYRLDGTGGINAVA